MPINTPQKNRFVQRYSQLISQKPAIEASNSDPLRTEILGLVSSVIGELADTIPENNYWALAAYTMLVPEILNSLTSYALPQSGMIGPTWNYLDAACQGIIGLQQLFDKATHRPLVTKAKGLLNIASNIQLITLTAVSATSLGPIGFAAAFGVSFILSIDESIRQMRRLYSPEYFLVDSLAELDKIEGLIKQKQKSLENLEALPTAEQRSKSGKLALKLVRSTLEELKEKRAKIQWQLEIKLDVDRYEQRQPGKVSTLDEIVTHYRRAQIKNSECLDYLNQLTNRAKPDKEQYEQAKKIDVAIKKETKLGIINGVSDSLLWGMAFTGMLLACIPGMQIPATALIAAASVIYFLKNSKKIVEKAQQIYRFFKKAAPPPEASDLALEEQKLPELNPVNRS